MVLLRKRAPPPHDFKLDMTPMVDVVFLLVVFFLCSIRFRSLEGKLAAYLPQGVGVNTGATAPLQRVDVRIQLVREGSRLHPATDEPWSGQGPFKYGSDRVVAFQVGARKMRDLDELRERLELLHGATPERGVTIDSGAGVVYADLMAVLDRAVSAGFDDITFKGAR